MMLAIVRAFELVSIETRASRVGFGGIPISGDPISPMYWFPSPRLLSRSFSCKLASGRAFGIRTAGARETS